jgi:antitoxin HicB
MYYTAVLEKDGKRTTIEFPECPGCSTFAEPDEDVTEVAREALVSWLEAELIQGEVPPRAAGHTWETPSGATARAIDVPPALAARLQIRWAREAIGISQGELAERMGVPRQQVSRIESSTGNLTIATIDRVARALGVPWSIQIGDADAQTSGAANRPKN